MSFPDKAGRGVKPRILDLFSGAGGCTKGYQEAGFYVVGVDHEPQPNYCGDHFIEADALDVLETLIANGGCIGVEEGADHWPEFWPDAIHASPPCQAYAEVAQGRKGDHPELLEPVRELLKETGLPWVIENVTNAPMPDSFVLCGSTFGLPIIRHRRFEVWPPIGLVPSACHQRKHGRGVDHGPGFYPYGRKTWEPAWREHVLPVVWPWMTLAEAGQAIPPAYCRFIGEHLLQHLKANPHRELVKYRTIVADPPWHYDGFATAPTPVHGTPGPVRVAALPYESMSLDEIAALPVAECAAKDCRLFLWTTNRYLPDAFGILSAWGFEYKQTLVWRKTGNPSPFGGSVAPNHAEYLLVATRGKPERVSRLKSSVIDAPAAAPGKRRSGTERKHSAKPDAFLDYIEQVSPGPYLEMFARRERLGWDCWGDESLGTVELVGGER